MHTVHADDDVELLLDAVRELDRDAATSHPERPECESRTEDVVRQSLAQPESQLAVHHRDEPERAVGIQASHHRPVRAASRPRVHLLSRLADFVSEPRQQRHGVGPEGDGPPRGFQPLTQFDHDRVYPGTVEEPGEREGTDSIADDQNLDVTGTRHGTHLGPIPPSVHRGVARAEAQLAVATVRESEGRLGTSGQAGGCGFGRSVVTASDTPPFVTSSEWALDMVFAIPHDLSILMPTHVAPTRQVGYMYS